MRGAEAIDEYIALPLQEAFDIEYWQLEEPSLKRMPAEKELARNVAVVIERAAESARLSLAGWRRKARTSFARTWTRLPRTPLRKS